MQFINPLKLLQLPLDGTAIDPGTVKRARKRLQAEIELNDGTIDYEGRAFSWPDLEPHISKLDDATVHSAYLYVARRNALSAFLTSGVTDSMSRITDQAMVPQNVLSLVSPYFAFQYNKAGERLFRAGDVRQLTALYAVAPLVLPSDRDDAHAGVARLLRSVERSLEKIEAEIKDGTRTYDEHSSKFEGNAHPVHLIAAVRKLANAGLLNALPEYFQKQRNAIAYAIRNISVAVWNGFSLGEPAENLLEYAIEITTDGHTSAKLYEDFGLISGMAQRAREAEAQGANVEHAITFLKGAMERIKSLQNREFGPASASSWVGNTLNVSLVNGLADDYKELRDQVALALRAMSVEVWNVHNDLDKALAILSYARQITGLSPEAQARIAEAQRDLDGIRLQAVFLGNLGVTPQAPTGNQDQATTNSKTSSVPQPAKVTSQDEAENNPGCLMMILAGILIGIGSMGDLDWLIGIGVLVGVIGFAVKK